MNSTDYTIGFLFILAAMSGLVLSLAALFIGAHKLGVWCGERFTLALARRRVTRAVLADSTAKRFLAAEPGSVVTVPVRAYRALSRAIRNRAEVTAEAELLAGAFRDQAKAKAELFARCGGTLTVPASDARDPFAMWNGKRFEPAVAPKVTLGPGHVPVEALARGAMVDWSPEVAKVARTHARGASEPDPARLGVIQGGNDCQNEAAMRVLRRDTATRETGIEPRWLPPVAS